MKSNASWRRPTGKRHPIGCWTAGASCNRFMRNLLSTIRTSISTTFLRAVLWSNSSSRRRSMPSASRSPSPRRAFTPLILPIMLCFPSKYHYSVRSPVTATRLLLHSPSTAFCRCNIVLSSLICPDRGCCTVFRLSTRPNSSAYGRQTPPEPLLQTRFLMPYSVYPNRLSSDQSACLRLETANTAWLRIAMSPLTCGGPKKLSCTAGTGGIRRIKLSLLIWPKAGGSSSIRRTLPDLLTIKLQRRSIQDEKVHSRAAAAVSGDRSGPIRMDGLTKGSR